VQPEALIATILKRKLPDTPEPKPPEDMSVKLIDWDGIDAAYGTKPHLITKLFKMTLDMHADKPAALRTAARAHDLDTMTRLGHALRGLAGSLQAPPVVEIATVLEKTARAQSADAPAHAERLADAMERLLAELDASLKARGEA